MTVLSDIDILDSIKNNQLGIMPFDMQQLQPASYDVRLGNVFLIPMMGLGKPISTEFPPIYKRVTTDSYTLFPGEFILARLIERILLPSSMCAKIEGKSSLGRMGLSIHVTAGLVDPGWNGILTLEIKNEAISYPITINAGMSIAQLQFSNLITAAKNPYKGRYQNSEDVHGIKFPGG